MQRMKEGLECTVSSKSMQKDMLSIDNRNVGIQIRPGPNVPTGKAGLSFFLLQHEVAESG